MEEMKEMIDSIGKSCFSAAEQKPLGRITGLLVCDYRPTSAKYIIKLNDGGGNISKDIKDVIMMLN